MNKETVSKLKNGFDRIIQVQPNIDAEFWYARDLQELLGYAQWRNFIE